MSICETLAGYTVECAQCGARGPLARLSIRDGGIIKAVEGWNGGRSADHQRQALPGLAHLSPDFAAVMADLLRSVLHDAAVYLEDLEEFPESAAIAAWANGRAPSADFDTLVAALVSLALVGGE